MVKVRAALFELDDAAIVSEEFPRDPAEDPEPGARGQSTPPGRLRPDASAFIDSSSYWVGGACGVIRASAMIS